MLDNKKTRFNWKSVTYEIDQDAHSIQGSGIPYVVTADGVVFQIKNWNKTNPPTPNVVPIDAAPERFHSAIVL